MGIKFVNPVPAAAGFMSGTRKAGFLAGLLLGTAFAASAIQVTYQVNMGTQIALGNFRPGTDTVFVSGTFSSPNWKSTASDGSTSYLLTPVAGNTNLYTGTFNIVNTAGSTEYHKFIINPGGNFSALNWESPVSTAGGNRSFIVPGVATNLPVVYFNDQTLPVAAPFVAGADFSHLAFFESRGVTYKDGGQVQDGIQILKNHGINCVRLRLFTSSAAQASANPYNYINNTTYTVPLAVRVKNAGLLFCLDFHYSDTWADPGHQRIPNAWTNGLTFPLLVQLMRIYNSNTIVTFAAAGAMPDYVQIGNEITSGMLWPYGQVNAYTSGGTQWTNLCQLIDAAIQGIKDATNATGAKMPKIIIHIDRGGDWTTTMKYFDNLNAQGVPFDIIGESYYPWWHGSPTSLNICLSNAAVRYGKPIIVAETAFPWTNTFPTSWTNFGSLYGFPPTRAGQVSFIAALAKVVKSVPNQLGAGVFYWGTEYQAVSGVNEAGFNTASFFDAGGNVLPVAAAFGGMASPLLIRPSLNGSNLQLQWPFSGAASKLMTTTTLAPSTAWSSVPDPIQTTGAVFTVTLPVDSSLTRFYRLQSN